MGDVMMCWMPNENTLPTKAKLSASVAPDVKNISEEEQFSNRAIVLRAFSTAVLASLPCEWMEEGFPK